MSPKIMHFYLDIFTIAFHSWHPAVISYYNTYLKYTAAYREVKLQAKDKLFPSLPLNLGCFYRRNIYLADTCVQSGYCSHSCRYCQNIYRTSFLTPVFWHKKKPRRAYAFFKSFFHDIIIYSISVFYIS